MSENVKDEHGSSESMKRIFFCVVEKILNFECAPADNKCQRNAQDSLFLHDSESLVATDALLLAETTPGEPNPLTRMACTKVIPNC
jgi:hypothetical protein